MGGISFMTIHRDLDDLEARGLIRKSRGWVTAMSSSVAEASDVFRQGQQEDEKAALAAAALELAGQSVFLDDSTTTALLAPLVTQRASLTIITNYLTLMNELGQSREVTLIGLGGTYMTWSSSFLGSVPTASIRAIAADLFIMSTSAVIDDVCYHHSQQTVRSNVRCSNRPRGASCSSTTRSSSAERCTPCSPWTTSTRSLSTPVPPSRSSNGCVTVGFR